MAISTRNHFNKHLQVRSLLKLMMSAQGTNRNFLEIFFVSALGKNDVKQPAQSTVSFTMPI